MSLRAAALLLVGFALQMPGLYSLTVYLQEFGSRLDHPRGYYDMHGGDTFLSQNCLSDAPRAQHALTAGACTRFTHEESLRVLVRQGGYTLHHYQNSTNCSGQIWELDIPEKTCVRHRWGKPWQGQHNSVCPRSHRGTCISSALFLLRAIARL